jgi:non-specific serine/threonine protein kinase
MSEPTPAGTDPTLNFGGLLREHRLALTLTQAALADRAGISTRAVQNLERSVSQPHRDTLLRLVSALALNPAAQAKLENAAGHSPRRRRSVEPQTRSGLATPGSGKRSNLPQQLTSFIGRQAQVAEAAQLLGGPQPIARLVTLTGTGGVGKTRLALEVAKALSDMTFPDGVWMVDLSSLVEPGGVRLSIATVLGLREEPLRPFDEVLLDALRSRRMLLVLDNCEHLVLACAQLARDILSACAGIAILTTSRVPLAIPGERVLVVQPLDQPRAAPQSLDELGRCDSVRLFLQRAAAASSHVALDSANAMAVADICRRLDGMPLALELAAAQTRALSVQQIAHRLDNCLSVLAGGDRTAPPRQQTLEAAVAWSYNLLDEQEQRFFTQLSIFAGGWSLEAAEEICADESAAPGHALVLLRRLIDNSLVVVDDGHDGCKWYRLLEPIRQFAVEKLRRAHGESELKNRHLAWYVQLALEAERLVRWTSGPATTKLEALEQLEANHDNLRIAWQWAAHGDCDVRVGLRLVGALLPFHFTFGFRSEGRTWIDVLLARDDAALPSRERASALSAAAGLAAEDGDHAAARAYAAEYLRLPVSLTDASSEAVAYDALGTAALRDGDGATAVAFYTRTVTLSRMGRDVSGSIYLTQLGDALRFQCDLDGADRIYEEALLDAQVAGVLPAVGLALRGLAAVAWSRRDLTAADAFYDRAVRLLDEIGALPHEVHSMLVSVGTLALQQRDLGRARHFRPGTRPRHSSRPSASGGGSHAGNRLAATGGGRRVTLNPQMATRLLDHSSHEYRGGKEGAHRVRVSFRHQVPGGGRSGRQSRGCCKDCHRRCDQDCAQRKDRITHELTCLTL